MTVQERADKVMDLIVAHEGTAELRDLIVEQFAEAIAEVERKWIRSEGTRWATWGARG